MFEQQRLLYRQDEEAVVKKHMKINTKLLTQFKRAWQHFIRQGSRYLGRLKLIS